MSHSFKKISNDPTARIRTFHSWFFWNDVFTDEELEKICQLMTSVPLEPGLTTRNRINDVNEINEINDVNSYRTSHVNFHGIDDSNFWIFERINNIVEHVNNNFYNFDLNGYNCFQYGDYRAEEHGHYNWHLDSHIGQLPANQFEQRKLSLTLLLNVPEKDFSGGDFQFNFSEEKSAVTAGLKKGTIIIFPSFLIHRVTEVTSGVRKSLVAWIVGPNFR
jgi:PKHD-type hydroxylase